MQKKVVVILSGGMDSSLVAFKMAKLGYQLITVHFSYGQRTENREKFSFNAISDALNVSMRYEIPLPFFKQIGVGFTSLIDKNLSLNENGVNEKIIPNSYVPFRNGIMLSIAPQLLKKKMRRELQLELSKKIAAVTQIAEKVLSKVLKKLSLLAQKNQI